MPPLYLLTRQISAYNFTNPLLLGVFTDKTLAQQQSHFYIKSIENNDPYFLDYQEVNLEKDLEIKPLDDDFIFEIDTESFQTAFLVAEIQESFGQEEQRFIGLFAKQSHAENFITEQEQIFEQKIANGETVFPTDFEIIEITKKQLLV